MPTVVIYFCAAMLLLAIAPLPYGYYTLLRLVACGIFAFAAFIACERKGKLLPWLFGFMALIFNPIIKVSFTKEVWMVIDVAAAILLVITAKHLRTEKN